MQDPNQDLKPKTENLIMDAYFILLTLAFFALTGGMVYLFDHL